MEDPSLQTSLTVVITIFSVLGLLLIAKGRRWLWFGRRDRQMANLAKMIKAPVTGGDSGKEAFIESIDDEGNDIRVHHHVEHYATNTRTMLSTELGVSNPAGISFSIASQSKAGIIAKTLGVKPLKTGDPDFDSNFVVKSTTPDLTITLLTPEVRELCSIAWDQKGAHGLMKLKDHVLSYSECGSLFSNVQVRRYEAIITLSKAIKKNLDSLTSSEI